MSGIKSLLKSDSSSTVGKGKEKSTFKAEWASPDQLEEDDAVDEHTGKDGKMNFVCSLAPKSSIKLLLEWEVSHPVGIKLAGM